MKEIIIEKNQAGQRFDKFLFKYFKEAPSSFIYKMLRKKNIVIDIEKVNWFKKGFAFLMAKFAKKKYGKSF